jgi:F-type H+-transporting ATPase subunit delta
MTEHTLAKRYARAILDVAKERGELDRVEQELHAVAELWSALPELRAILRHPTISRERKRRAVEEAFRGRVTDLVLRFLIVLIEKGRFGAIEEIARIYDELTDEYQGIARVSVTAWAPLEEAERAALVAKLQKFTDRPKIVLRETVDPEILGGLVVRVGDQVIDGSIRGRLQTLRERLLIREPERGTEAARIVATGGAE